MGIDVYGLNFLLSLQGACRGDVLCLGRQGFHIDTPGSSSWSIAQQLLENHAPGTRLNDLVRPDGYSENLWAFLGARSVTSLDFSPFEQAQLIHDLNFPVPPELSQRFDVIFDGGTLEHVFNIPMAFQNIRIMLKKDGIIISINGANNQLGHGLYQFSPELFWRAFGFDSGFIVERMQLVPVTGLIPQPQDLVDTPGIRQEVGQTPHPTYLMMAARRVSVNGCQLSVYQSDYLEAWHQRQP